MELNTPKILVVATASAAIVKTKQVVELLQKDFIVKLALSDYAQKNYPLAKSWKVIKENKNLTSYPDHIKWAKWADLILVVPATTNTISKFYYTLADNFASSILLASRQPILFVPAMNTWMYQKLLKRKIIFNLAKEGHLFIGPTVGKLKENEIGMGRMKEPEEIVKAVKNYLRAPLGKTILLPYGASKVQIDPVRYLTNRSSGLMGKLLAQALRLAGFKVKAVDIGNYTNQQFLEYAKQESWDLYISPAAFADFSVSYEDQKIKKGSLSTLNLKNNIDVISELKFLYPKRHFFAFKLDNNEQEAIKKKNALNLDGIIWNKVASMNDDQTSGKIFFGDDVCPFENYLKSDLASLIAEKIAQKFKIYS